MKIRNQCTLLDLPPEIVAQIASYLFAGELFCFRATCKHVAEAVPFAAMAAQLSWGACFRSAGKSHPATALANRARMFPADVLAVAAAAQHARSFVNNSAAVAPILLALWRKHFKRKQTLFDDAGGAAILLDALQSSVAPLARAALSSCAAAMQSPWGKMPANRQAVLELALSTWSLRLRESLPKRTPDEIALRADLAAFIASCNAAQSPPPWWEHVRFRLQVAIGTPPTPPRAKHAGFTDTDSPSPLSAGDVVNNITLARYFEEWEETAASVGGLVESLLEPDRGPNACELLRAVVAKSGHLVNAELVLQRFIKNDYIDSYAALARTPMRALNAKQPTGNCAPPQSASSAGGICLDKYRCHAVEHAWGVVETAVCYDAVGIFSFEVGRLAAVLVSACETALHLALNRGAVNCLLWLETFAHPQLISGAVLARPPAEIYSRFSLATANGHRMLTQFIYRHAAPYRSEFDFIIAQSLGHRPPHFNQNMRYIRYALEHTVRKGLGFVQRLDPFAHLCAGIAQLDPAHVEFALRLALHSGYSDVAEQTGSAPAFHAVVLQLGQGQMLSDLLDILQKASESGGGLSLEGDHFAALEKIVGKLSRWLPRLFLRSELGLVMAAGARSRKYVNASVAELWPTRRGTIAGARALLARAGNLLAADLIASAVGGRRVFAASGHVHLR